MDPLLILLIIMIVYVVYLIFQQKNKPIEKYTYDDKKYKLTNVDDTFSQVIDDMISLESISNDSLVLQNKTNPIFINNKFNNDYRDVITALNNLVPRKQQIFNLPNIPLKYTEPQVSEVKGLLKDFIKILNDNINNVVPDYRNKNSGWDEAIPNPNMTSGWDKLQKSLGLLPSLWKSPAGKSSVKLIKINNVQKYETDDEIKYTIAFVIQKDNSSDQMVLSCSFVQDKRPLNDENNFFRSVNVDMRVMIEDTYVLGYLSKYGQNAGMAFDDSVVKYLEYDKMEYQQLGDPKEIQKVLMDKYKLHTQEMEMRNAMLDEEGQAFHKELPNVYDYSTYRDTWTIQDDMNRKKYFS